MNDFHDLCDTYLGMAPLDMVLRTVCTSDTPAEVLRFTIAFRLGLIQSISIVNSMIVTSKLF